MVVMANVFYDMSDGVSRGMGARPLGREGVEAVCRVRMGWTV